MSSISYPLFKGISDKLAQRLSAFKAIYLSSGLREPFNVYISEAIAVSVFGIPFVFMFSFIIHSVAMKLSLIRAIAASIIISLVYAIMAFAIMLYYPLYRRYSMAGRIDAQLPFSVGYMAALASAGVGVERLVEEAALVERTPELKHVLSLIIRDIKLLGYDTATALDRAAERSPSMMMSVFLLGLRDTFVTSGDLKEYLVFMARRLIQHKMNTIRHIMNTLAVIGEMYVTATVVAPLMFIIMMVIMSLLGGGILGLPPTLLIFILTVVVIPVSAVMILVIIDGLLSKV